MKNFYIVFTARQYDEEGNPLYYADTMSVSPGENVYFSLDCIGGLLHANICETKKRAKAIADCWNEAYKKNGEYLFA